MLISFVKVRKQSLKDNTTIKIIIKVDFPLQQFFLLIIKKIKYHKSGQLS
jgi:hypothetical protein